MKKKVLGGQIRAEESASKKVLKSTCWKKKRGRKENEVNQRSINNY